MKKKPHPAGERRRETVTMKDLMDAMLKSYNIDRRFDQASLVTKWNKIMGTAIANRTTNLEIRKDVLIITLSSAPLKHELNNSKQKVMDMVNAEFGKRVVNQVLFV
ncbi:DUF721 domain-containing protein [Gilvimarinus agarilyticus]|uniref:DUF721 domain-containing protein n=1 Tax=Reichenbachiella agariperforans TaxID=156994 RepID=A0A1M6N0D3_REIAG|nr:DUF721 domain-containing protein [Reichenbachiella agariperforans]MBU2887909.1 DUF721 domain-containing protein [Gilvimarinus agarilyticus]MBU2915665.1 DUF721 domain-containing protein [Reichenbachiella agariperforans]SHJ89160.1 Protein of unknown function [Reichenbachiella agariperforans]